MDLTSLQNLNKQLTSAVKNFFTFAPLNECMRMDPLSAEIPSPMVADIRITPRIEEADAEAIRAVK